MTGSSRYWFVAALGACITSAQGPLAAQTPLNEPPRLGALTPAPAPSANQRMANALAEQLRQSGQLRHYSVDLVYRNGTVEVSGSVSDQPQREEVLRIIQGVPGVDKVVDRLTLASAITPVKADAKPLPAPDLAPPPRTPPPPPPGAPRRAPPGGALAPPPGGARAEPVPVFQGTPPAPYEMNPPKMPPYAWPTYAPYNNYSRVAYPTAYPYNAWPFIGPIYPYPKIPLGWRSVKLEWDDGYWWYSRTATKYDWWKLRYW